MIEADVCSIEIYFEPHVQFFVLWYKQYFKGINIQVKLILIITRSWVAQRPRLEPNTADKKRSMK